MTVEEEKERDSFVPLIDTVRSLVEGSNKILFGSDHPILESIQMRRSERAKKRPIQGVIPRSRTQEGGVSLRQSLADRLRNRENPLKQAIADRLRPAPTEESDVKDKPKQKEEQGQGEEEESLPEDQRDHRSSYSGKTETRGGRRAM